MPNKDAGHDRRQTHCGVLRKWYNYSGEYTIPLSATSSSIICCESSGIHSSPVKMLHRETNNDIPLSWFCPNDLLFLDRDSGEEMIVLHGEWQTWTLQLKECGTKYLADKVAFLRYTKLLVWTRQFVRLYFCSEINYLYRKIFRAVMYRHLKFDTLVIRIIEWSYAKFGGYTGVWLSVPSSQNITCDYDISEKVE